MRTTTTSGARTYALYASHGSSSAGILVRRKDGRRLTAWMVIAWLSLSLTGGCRLPISVPDGQEEESETDCPPDCESAPYNPERYESIQFQGITRTYTLYVPDCYDANEPIAAVFNLHGGGGTGEAAEIGIGGMHSKAEEACFIAVHPNAVSAIDEPGRRQYWNAGPLVPIPDARTDVDDVGFIAALLDDLEGRFNIDPGRVYATGASNGAWMTYRLACELSDRICAIAPIAGGLVVEDCQPTEPVSVLHFHGTADPGWPFNGGPACFTDGTRQPIAETIEEWVALNDCGPPTVTLEAGDVTCESYGCTAGTEVVFCVIAEGGHTYPGGVAFALEQLLPWDADCALGDGRGVGAVNQDISALDMMWDFFEQHARP